MPATVKVAISLPSALFQTVERERGKRQETRSEFFRQAVQDFLKSLEEREAVRRYVRGYTEQPETASEIEAFGTLSRVALAGEPWD